MFDPLKTEVTTRFDAVESYFKASYALGVRGNSAQIAKGMVFVQTYAIYEYTVVTAVQTAVDAVTAHQHPVRDLLPSLMSLFLDPELKSIRGCAPKNEWSRRLSLFKRVFSSDPAVVDNTVMPIDGTHFRASELELIFEVFGIHRLPVRRRRHFRRINEVVEHRNAIAHGRETAENIGRRYTRSDVLQAVRQMKSVCLLLVAIIKHHCNDPARHRSR